MSPEDKSINLYSLHVKLSSQAILTDKVTISSEEAIQSKPAQIVNYNSSFSFLDILAYLGAYLFLFKFMMTPLVQAWIHRNKFYNELGMQMFYLLPGPDNRGNVLKDARAVPHASVSSENKRVKIGI